VTVHCTGGVSRSPAVILAYLWHLDGTFERAVARLGRAVQTGIDEDFFYQLAEFHGTVLTAPEVKAVQQKLMGRS
jgi:protein-tyrosine phosphatase